MWERIREEYETTNKTLKEIAEEYNFSPGTVRSRKHREGWEKRNATKKKTATQRKKKKAALPKKTPKLRREKIIEDVVIENEDLTEKQRLFCIYYVKYWNATKAYQKAYDCSYQTANVRGPTLLGNVSVKQEISRLKKLITSGVYLEAMAILQKYIDIAFADITDFISFGQKEVPVNTNDDMGNESTKIVNFIDLKDSSIVDGTIITEVSQGRDGIKVKLADKMKALDKLDKYFDLFPDKFKRKIESEKLKLLEERLKLEREKLEKDQGNTTNQTVVIVDDIK